MAPEARKEWCKDQEFRKFQSFLDSLKVTNDVAERGVKIMQDYAWCVQDEELLQSVLQVVGHHRRRTQSFGKIEPYENVEIRGS